ETGLTGSVTHDFGVAGTDTIRIQGTFPTIFFNNSGDAEKLISIEQWGSIAWETLDSAFYGCINMVINATDAPDLSAVNSLTYTFAYCNSLSHNPNLTSWNVSTITTMDGTFYGARFNGDISTWDVRNVTSFNDCFRYNNIFNCNISNWDVSSVTDFTRMFYGVTSFNQDISAWDVSSASSMRSMFNSATAFSSDLSSWNVSNLADAKSMFYGCTSFNSDISAWNTESLVSMAGMFNGATSFDKNLGGWNISGINSTEKMLDVLNNTNLSASNYDATIKGWASQSVLQNIDLGTVSASYCTASTERNTLTVTNGWSITDEGLQCDEYNHFITTWKTDNDGTSGTTEITIPINSSYTYNYDVDWDNDGVFDETGLTGSVTHDFGTAGTYIIRIQ
ncbi:MAG: DUF285 domain-containing protein, partial [Bacteroidales bacterium]|nr:DUF285 domain-containing protein [Bacteroidales bacterium]